ncbi:phage tail tape measure protein (plasmid) [Ralstonia syzygii subsp. celebesensis]|uniref:phage tail tape measure protein n=1 Tax=Ralstonia syzygii TaxID=28097 RepID=UPI00387E0D30
MGKNFEIAVNIIGRASSALAAFGSVKQSVTAMGSAVSQLRGKQSELGNAIQRHMGTLAPRTLAALNQQYVAIGRTIDQLQAKQARLSALQAQGMALREMRSDLRGQAFGTLGTAAAVGVPIVQSVRQAAGFQDQMRDIAITGEFSKAEEANLGNTVRDAAGKWNQTQAEVARGIGVLVAGGIQDAKELERYTPVIAKAATATRASMDDLGNVMLALKTNLGVSAGETEQAFNMLAYAGKRGQFEIKDMAKWLPTLTPSFAAMGVTGKEAVAEIGAALQVARKGAGTNDEAANNFRNFLQKLFSQDTKKDFEKAGIDIEQSLKNLREKGLTPVQGMLEIITSYIGKKSPEAAAQFQNAMSMKDDKEREMALQRISEAYKLGELFQDMQAMNFIRPAIANMAEMKDIKQGSFAAADKGLLDADFKKRVETATEQFKAFKIGLTEVGITIGNVLLPPLVSALNTVLPVVRAFGNWAKEHPGWIKGVIGLASGLLAGKLALIGIRYAALLATSQFNAVAKGITLVSSGWTRLQAMRQMGNVSAASGGIGKIGSSLLTGFQAALPWIGRAGTMLLRLTPIGLALSAVGVLVYKYWQPIKGFMVGLWQGIASVAGPAIKGLIRSVMSFGLSIGRLLLAIPGVGFVFRLLRSVAAPVLGAMLQGVRAVWNWFKNLLKPVDDVGGRAQNMGRKVGTVLGGIVRALVSLPAQFLKLGGDLVDGLVNGIKAKLGEAVKAVSNLGSEVANTFKSALGIHSPSRVFMGFGDNVAQGAAIGMTRSTSHASQAAASMAQSTIAAANKAGVPASAGSRAPTGAGGAGGGVTIHLTQTFTLDGAGKDVKAQVQQAAQLSVQELEKMMERVFERKQRRGYA